MKSILCILLLLFGMTVMCNKNMEQGSYADMQAIETLHEADQAASRVFDFQALLTLWTEDGVLLEPGKEPVIGIEALKKYMQTNEQTPRDYEILEYRHDFQEVRILGDWAYEWGTFEGMVRILSTGEKQKSRARLLRILKKMEDGSWKCARAIWHEHPVSEEQ
jgi:uncharacterized protein (TIGR02246 family)